MAQIENKALYPRWDRSTSLTPCHVITVKVASFTFRFGSVEELQRTIEYYSQKIHPSSRISAQELQRQLGEDWRTLRGWDVERWFERLPMYLLEEPKRQKVLKALLKTQALLASGKLSF